MSVKIKRIDWNNIKVTLVKADLNNLNPQNSCSHMTQKQRKEEIIEISAQIWMRHCREKLEKETECRQQ